MSHDILIVTSGVVIHAFGMQYLAVRLALRGILPVIRRRNVSFNRALLETLIIHNIAAASLLNV